MTVEINDNSPQVKAEFQSAVLRALEKCGLVAEGYAKRLCPVDTGNMRNSITHALVGTPGKTLKYTPEMQKAGKEPTALEVPVSEENVLYIGSAVFYAPYLEMGTGKYYSGGRQEPWLYKDAKGETHMTSGGKAQPFLKPAIADHVQQYKGIIEDELKG